MIVLDNLLSSQHFHHISTYLSGEEPDWYFNGNLSGTQRGAKYGFGKGIVHHQQGIINPLCWQLAYPPLAIAADKSNMQIDHVYSVFMTLPMPYPPNPLQQKHVDLDIEHTVFLFYLTTHDEESAATMFFEGDEVVERVQPVANRGIIFDGNLMHAGGVPIYDRRIILNYDFKMCVS